MAAMRFWWFVPNPSIGTAIVALARHLRRFAKSSTPPASGRDWRARPPHERGSLAGRELLRLRVQPVEADRPAERVAPDLPGEQAADHV
jgi:hypothetical protein